MTASRPTREPLPLAPLLKPRVWGGHRLVRFGKAIPPGVRIGESWELADLDVAIPDGQSRIASGPLAGTTLHEAIQSDPEGILGDALTAEGGRFPLLVKFLDAAESLSVQVHPNPTYAARDPAARVKDEAWVVLDAAPGAVIYRGIRPEIERSRFFEDVARGTAVDDLIAVPVSAGDCIDLPSGLCHALGAGVLVAEVQTPSDTTYRVYDWDRCDPSRRLHLEEAQACMLFGEAQDLAGRPIVRRAEVRPFRAAGFETRPLCRNDRFAIEWIDAAADSSLPVVTNGVPVIWTMLAGHGELAGTTPRSIPIRTGDTILMPALATGWTARFPAPSALLRTTVPTFLDRAIAAPVGPARSH